MNEYINANIKGYMNANMKEYMYVNMKEYMNANMNKPARKFASNKPCRLIYKITIKHSVLFTCSFFRHVIL